MEREDWKIKNSNVCKHGKAQLGTFLSWLPFWKKLLEGVRQTTYRLNLVQVQVRCSKLLIQVLTNVDVLAGIQPPLYILVWLDAHSLGGRTAILNPTGLSWQISHYELNLFTTCLVWCRPFLEPLSKCPSSFTSKQFSISKHVLQTLV